MTYRYTFYNIPYMRGGTDVPALSSGDVAETQLEKYFIMEIFSQRQFSEEQVQLVFSEGESLAASQANYMRVAKTQNTIQKDYSTDSNVSFWWVDDVQLLGAVNAAGELAARVTISPDVWLTDFWAAESDPKFSGRVLQTTYPMSNYIKQLPIEPLYTLASPSLINIDKDQYGDNVTYEIIACVSTEQNQLAIIGTNENYNSQQLSFNISLIASSSTIKFDEENTKNFNLLKVYVVPHSWVSIFFGTQTAEFIVSQTSVAAGYTLSSVGDWRNVLTPDSPAFWGDCVPAFLATPSRIIEIGSSISYPITGLNGVPFLIKAAMCGAGADSISITLFINGEIIDISDDFLADFSVNDAAIKQSQQKSLMALNAISGTVGAISGVFGAVNSGNYFGAVASVAGYPGNILSNYFSRKQPGAVRSGGDAITSAANKGLLSWIYFEEYPNKAIVQYNLNRYGYIYPENPYFNGRAKIYTDKYARFSEIDVHGMTGGQSAAIEVANAFLRGVRLKTL